MVWLIWGGRMGAVLTSLTVTVKVLVALRGGEPLSTTRVVKVLMLGPCASVGVQVMTPLAEITALAGGGRGGEGRGVGGRCESVAVLVTGLGGSAFMVRLGR